MKFTIDSIEAHGAETGQMRHRWQIEGNIDGRPVSISYLDSGNNAEYDTSTVLDVDAAKQSDVDAIENWFDECILCDLGKGSVIDLPDPKPAAAKPLPLRFPRR